MTDKIPNVRRKPSNLIPHKVALFDDREEKEIKPFHISYESYKRKLCEICNLKQGQSRKALRDMVIIGGMCNINQFPSNNIQAKPIKNSGEYKKLYTRLPEDIDLKEHKIGGSARIFYYMIDRIIFIVAIKSKHLETNKNRR